MTQSSYPWNGIVLGDSAAGLFTAPYDASEYASINHKTLASSIAKGFVIPEYGNNLAITANSPAAMNVLVDTGAAQIAGKFYENDAQATLTISASDPTNPRIDRCVLRVDFAAQTIRLAVLTGTPAATPVLPTLTQSLTTTYEISLAYVWVAATATTLAATEVHDERIFATNWEFFNTLSQENLVPNSEFLAFAAAINGAGNLLAPDTWATIGSPTQVIPATKPTQMTRGRAVQITSDAVNEGIRTFIPVKPSTSYTVSCLVNVTSGAGRLAILSDGVGAVSKTVYIRRIGAWVEETYRFTTESDATYVQISLLCLTSGAVVKFGQVLMAEGPTTGPFRECHETILFTYALTDSSWDGDAKSTGSTSIDLDTSYGGLIQHKEVRAVYLLVRANDSGSAAGAAALNIETAAAAPSIINQLDSVGNDKVRAVMGWIQLNKFDATIHIIYHVFATGAGTLDANVEIWGIVT